MDYGGVQSLPLHWARNAEYPRPAAVLGDDATGFRRTGDTPFETGGAGKAL
ncbi:MAG: hypothetical protein LBL45_09460 [Treponema sp.]|nr:hypothetical protein [Treponema sp.]